MTCMGHCEVQPLIYKKFVKKTKCIRAKGRLVFILSFSIQSLIVLCESIFLTYVALLKVIMLRG
jgi:hypothetical protein